MGRDSKGKKYSERRIELGLFWLQGLNLFLSYFFVARPWHLKPSIYIDRAALGFGFQAFCPNLLAIFFATVNIIVCFSNIQALHTTCPFISLASLLMIVLRRLNSE
jgi:hypothetical protein